MKQVQFQLRHSAEVRALLGEGVQLEPGLFGTFFARFCSKALYRWTARGEGKLISVGALNPWISGSVR
jgi:hypothetical protein